MASEKSLLPPLQPGGWGWHFVLASHVLNQCIRYQGPEPHRSIKTVESHNMLLIRFTDKVHFYPGKQRWATWSPSNLFFRFPTPLLLDKKEDHCSLWAPLCVSHFNQDTGPPSLSIMSQTIFPWHCSGFLSTSASIEGEGLMFYFALFLHFEWPVQPLEFC